MKAYEYKVVGSRDELKELGLQGWRLVSTCSSDRFGIQFVLEREFEVHPTQILPTPKPGSGR